MNPARRKKIGTLIFFMLIISAVVGLVLYALRQNINLFYTPTQIAQGQAPAQRTIRLGGMVEKNSIIRAKKGLEVQFKVTDYQQSVTVFYNGILPDLFREEQGIVTEGIAVNDHYFRASSVLAKHDANYMPPQVKAALAKKRQS